MTPPDAHRGPVSRRVFAALLVFYLLVRIGLGAMTGDEDSQYYQNWAYGIASGGIAAAYESTGVDYPPVVLYVFYPIGKVYKHFQPRFRPMKLHRSVPFALLIKTPHLVFDLAIAALLYILVARSGVWRSPRATPGWGRLAALLYLWNPAVLWGSAYWGQLDSIHTALAVAALAALGYRRVTASGALLAASGLMKPLAAPLVPILIMAAAALRGLRGVAAAGAGGLAVGAVLFLPFIATGRFFATLEKVVGDLDAMAFTSMNSHNLWMALGSWRPSSEAIVGPLSPRTLGLLLFSAACAPLLVRSWHWLADRESATSDYLARLFLLAAAVHTSFFFVSVNMHENHLFECVALLLVVAGRSRPLAILAVLCSVAAFSNMALHDLDLPYRLPSLLSARSPVIDPYLVFDNRLNPTPHAYGVDLHYTWLQLVGITANTTAVFVLACATYRLAWQGRIGSEPANG